MGLIVDITERKKNEQLLQIIESNINSMKDCLAIRSGARWLYLNKAVESLLEYPVENFYKGGRDFVLKNCIHKDDLQKETDAARDDNYLEKDRIRVVTASGKVKWVDIVRSSNEYLGKKCKVIICRDITEAVSHENMRDLLINALNVSKDVFILTSHSYFGVKYFYSKSIEKLIGLNIKEFYDDHHRIGEFIHPEDLSAFRSSFDMKEIIESGKKLPGLIKYRIIDAKGKIKWLESHFFYFMDKNTIHIGCVMRDITENKIENDTLKKAEQKAVFEEKLKIANKLKEENVSSDIILKTTGVDINSK
jgi:PAS domain-containing protein